MAQAKNKKPKKTKKAGGTKVTLVPADDLSAGDEDIDAEEKEEEESGMFLDKEDIQLIFNALSKYIPTEREGHLHGILLEEFEEILVVDYGEPFPDVN